MVAQSRLRRGVPEDWSQAGTYGTVGLLVFTSAILAVAVGGGANGLANSLVGLLGPTLAGALVYATLAFGVGGAVYAVVRRSRSPSARHDRPALSQAAGVAALLLFVAALVLHRWTSFPAVPREVVFPLLSAAVSLGLPAVVFARISGIDLPIGFPGRDEFVVAGVAALLAGVIGVAWLVGYDAVVGGGIFGLAVPGGRFAPSVTVVGFVWQVLVPGVAVGLGLALLYTGGIQMALEQRLGTTGGVAVTTAIVGIYMSPLELGPVTDAVGVVGTNIALTVLALGAAIVAVRGTHIAVGRLGGGNRPITGATVGLAAAVLLQGTLALAVAGLDGFAPVLAGTTATAAAALASVAFARTHSVWAPAAAFVSYLLVLDRAVAVHLLALVG